MKKMTEWETDGNKIKDLILSLQMPLKGYTHYISQPWLCISLAISEHAQQLEEASSMCSNKTLLNPPPRLYGNPFLLQFSKQAQRSPSSHNSSAVSDQQSRSSVQYGLTYWGSPQPICCCIWLEISRETGGGLYLETSGRSGYVFWYILKTVFTVFICRNDLLLAWVLKKLPWSFLHGILFPSLSCKSKIRAVWAKSWFNRQFLKHAVTSMIFILLAQFISVSGK